MSRIIAAAWCVTVAMAGPVAAQSVDDLAIHGFASQGYLNSTSYDYLNSSEQGSAELQEFAVNLSTMVREDLRIGMQLFARDLGRLGDNQVELDWAYGDFRRDDRLALRAGRVKMPYGFYNETSDFDAVRTAVLLPQSVYDVRFRDVMMAVNGASVYGLVGASWLGDFEYDVYGGTLGASPDGSVAQLFGDAGFFVVDALAFDHAAGGQLIWNTPLEGLRLAETFNHWSLEMGTVLTPPAQQMLGPLGATSRQRFTMPNVNFLTHGAEYMHGNLVLVAEHSTWKADMNNPFMQSAMDYRKWYVQGSYRVNEWLELGSYYSRHVDEGAKAAGAVAHRTFQDDLAVSARFDVSYAMIVKAEFHTVDGTAQLYQSQNPALMLDPAGATSNWNYFALKTSFVF